MSERLPEDLLKKFVGTAINDVKTRIRTKKLVKFAKAIGAAEEKYIGDNAIQHPAYIGSIIVKALFSLADAKVQNEKGEDVKLITNAGKVLHGGQGYKYYPDAPPLKDGEIIVTSGKLTNVYIKNGMLFLEAKMTTKNEAGEIVQDTFLSAIVRPGGF